MGSSPALIDTHSASKAFIPAEMFLNALIPDGDPVHGWGTVCSPFIISGVLSQTR